MSGIKNICIGIGAAFLVFWLLGSINLLEVHLYIGPAKEAQR